MSYTTDNPERDALLLAAIKKVIEIGRTPNLKLVSRALPHDFDLEQGELDGMLGNLNFNHLPKSLEKIEPPRANETEPPHNPPAEPAPIPESQARAILGRAQQRLSTARNAMVLAQSVLKERRADLAIAIHNWQLLGTQNQQTFENLIRDTIRANQQYKQDVIDGKVQPPKRGGPRGRSYIDASRSGWRGDGNDFARRSNIATAGTGGQRVVKGFNRGAYSKSDAMHVEAARLRAAAAARKLP